MPSTPVVLRHLATSLPSPDESAMAEVFSPTSDSNANEVDCEPACIPPQLRRKFSPPHVSSEEEISPSYPPRVEPKQEMHFAALQGDLRARAIEALRRRDATSLAPVDAMEAAPKSG